MYSKKVYNIKFSYKTEICEGRICMLFEIDSTDKINDLIKHFTGAWN